MTLLLVFPPFTDASQPNAAIPSLVAALHRDGVKVAACDANLDAWDYLLAPARLKAWLAKARRRLHRLDQRRVLTGSQRSSYLALLDGCLRGAATLPCIAGAPETFRSERFYSPEAYAQAQQAVQGALALVSAVHHPARLEWGRFWPACRVESSAAIMREAVRTDTNPFVAYTREDFIPKARALGPKLIGFSVTYLDQVVPTLTMARECKRAFPEVRIVLGGQIVSLWSEDILRAKSLWPWVDCFVCGEGESALRGLVKWLEGGLRLEDVPNLVLPARRISRTRRLRESLQGLPCPDYSCVPLGRYLAPEPVLLVSSSRGCYWGRCSFCSVSPAFRPGYRARPSEEVLADLRELQSRHGARCIMFGDDAISPAMLRALAREGGNTPSPVKWQAEVRWDALEPDAMEELAKGGACNLVIGLESGNEQVLAQMRKGASLAHGRRLLAACKRAGIGVNLQCFLGFPTETGAQALDTLAFIRECLSEKVTVSCGSYYLIKGSEVWRFPSRFGASLPPTVAGDDLPVQFERKPGYGCALQRRLIRQVKKMGYAGIPQMGCGINAHALLCLASGGRPLRVAAAPFDPLAKLRLGARTGWISLAWNPASLKPGQRPKRMATMVGCCLDQATIHALGPVSALLVRACQRPSALSAILADLGASERSTVIRRLRALNRKGLVENCVARAGG
jgi:anaerobic magnesium-protoporphyrin IX monomethyl ester cyclase